LTAKPILIGLCGGSASGKSTLASTEQLATCPNEIAAHIMQIEKP
jgi:uridine kinase